MNRPIIYLLLSSNFKNPNSLKRISVWSLGLTLQIIRTHFFSIRLYFLSLKHTWLPKHDYSKYYKDIWMNDTVLLESHGSITFEPSKWLQYPLIYSQKHNWYGVSNSVFRLWTHPKILNKRLCQSNDLQYKYWYLGLAFFGWYDHKMDIFDITGQFIDFKPDRNFLQLFIKYIL